LVIVGRVFFSPIATVDAPEPAVSADLEVVLDDLAPSVVTAPVVFDLTEAIALLDSLVPVAFGDLDTRLRFASRPRVSAAFTAQRTPFRVVVDDGDLVLETIVTYEGRGWYKPPLLPELSAGCGSGDAPKPRVRVRIRSVPDVRRDWRLATRTRITMAPVSFEPRDECRVTTFRIDVTEKLVEGVQGILQPLRESLDVTQRRGRHAVPQGAAEGLQALGVTRQVCGDFEIAVGIVCGQLGQADLGQEGEGLTAYHAALRPGHHRDAHPQRLAAGQP
jgi:hypothetical protein